MLYRYSIPSIQNWQSKKPAEMVRGEVGSLPPCRLCELTFESIPPLCGAEWGLHTKEFVNWAALA